MTQKTVFQGDAKSQSHVSVGSSIYSEKQGASCTVHGPSQTPHLDRQLQQPETKEILQALSVAFNDIADERQCTKCAVETTSSLLTGYIREVKAAKKNGQYSKEEKKALKKEIKGLAKVVKRDFKALWLEGK
ncbi:hypothetical protein BDV30DRAFT_236692 [Aspergillus minisclerotigenes]|uniref:Uncharacterized protein n=1 Tax=Aspergillus minisclerotigenes TaxID=656917 RepID=A0A5N6JBJ3_9EURO|nr:hypothetical protein BDV30DRAFT_236692 [Aspergillus minisclerotigenes]